METHTSKLHVHLAKDLSVVKKTVRKSVVWSQEKSAVNAEVPRGAPSPRCVWTDVSRTIVNFGQCLVLFKCNCCILVVA